MANDAKMHLSLSARGFTDQDIGNIVSKEIMGKACTSIDLSSNFITQRGAAVLANELKFNTVSVIISRVF